MIKTIIDDDNLDAPRFELSDSERTVLMGIAMRKAILWGSTAAAIMMGVNLALKWAGDTGGDPLWVAGLSWFLLVSIIVFFWQRRTLLARAQTMLDGELEKAATQRQ